MSDPFGIRAATRKVLEQAQNVRISDEAIHKLAAKFHSTLNQEWDTSLHFFDGTEKTVGWLLALDAANFSFWPDPGEQKWRVNYEGRVLDGYNALAAAMKRAVEEGFAIWNPAFLASLPEQRLRFILRGEGGIPLLMERLQNLRETGAILLRQFDGSSANLIQSAKQSAVGLVRLLVERFPSFRDTSNYNGFEVPFYKRAQLFVSDLHAAFQGNSFGAFHDMEILTAFADYKVPQILRKEGVMVYGEKLSRIIASRAPIQAGSDEEIEIRAATVQAVEQLHRAVRERGGELLPFQADGWLWRLSQDLSDPYHLTRTIFY